MFLRRRPANSCTRREKQARGEGQHSKGTDQTERGRDESWEDAKQAALWPGPWNPPPQIDISIFSPLFPPRQRAFADLHVSLVAVVVPLFLSLPPPPCTRASTRVTPGLPTVFPVMRGGVRSVLPPALLLCLTNLKVRD